MSEWLGFVTTDVDGDELTKLVVSAPISVQHQIMSALVTDYHEIGFEIVQESAYDDTDLLDTFEHQAEVAFTSVVASALEGVQQAMAAYLSISGVRDRVRDAVVEADFELCQCGDFLCHDDESHAAKQCSCYTRIGIDR